MVSEAQTVLSAVPALTSTTLGSGSILNVIVCETLVQPAPKV